MKLRNDQRMFDAEVVINTVVKLDQDGNVENKEALQKCPHCRVGTGRACLQGMDEESGQSEIVFVCDRCAKRWTLKFKNPILHVQI